MFRTITAAAVASLLWLLTASALHAGAPGPKFSDLRRDADVLHGTIESISSEEHTLTLQGPDGTRQTIHYNEDTVVFNGDGSAAAKVVPGQEVVVRCRREVATIRAQSQELCPMRLFADSVYLATH